MILRMAKSEWINTHKDYKMINQEGQKMALKLTNRGTTLVSVIITDDKEEN